MVRLSRYTRPVAISTHGIKILNDLFTDFINGFSTHEIVRAVFRLERGLFARSLAFEFYRNYGASISVLEGVLQQCMRLPAMAKSSKRVSSPLLAKYHPIALSSQSQSSCVHQFSRSEMQ